MYSRYMLFCIAIYITLTTYVVKAAATGTKENTSLISNAELIAMCAVMVGYHGYDVVLTAPPHEVIRKFQKFNANVIFSAEGVCWPDSSLAPIYPTVKVSEKRYLNSGGFRGCNFTPYAAPQRYPLSGYSAITVTSYIGYLAQIKELLVGDIKDDDDDQLYFTRQFLNEKLRSTLQIKLDTRSVIFQNLYGALGDINLKYRGKESYIYNLLTGNVPVVVHGNGPIKTEFSTLTNYLVRNWVPLHGCLACREDTFNLNLFKEENWPKVFVAIFIESPTMFLEDFFQHVFDLVYPKKKIDIFIHYSGAYHERVVTKFASLYRSEYSSIQVYSPNSGLNDKQARNLALRRCKQKNCDYYFSIDSEVQLENVLTLNLLISQNRSIIAPLMSRPGRVWSNFWGALTSDGYYKRSADYMEIVERKRLGLWNVPHISGVYLINRKLISKLQGVYIDGNLDSDMTFCMKMREQLFFMYVDNQVYYGHLTDSSNYDTSHLHNDLYAFFDNRYTWEKKYINPEYYTVLQSKTVLQIDQPCRDVYTFPLMTPVLGQHLIEVIESYGFGLSGAKEDTARAEMHLVQIGWEKQWLHILREFLLPVNLKLYPGYMSEGLAKVNYVARYRRGEQNYSRSQHELSTFTVILPLNQPGVDFQGGGVRFVRYNCTVSNSHRGWLLVFPGHITHRHEVLPVLEGTQYSLVSFVDP